jgi:ketosteroid isomerase-like protein
MSSTWDQDIRAREEENRAAFLAADLETLERLWTDDFVVNSPINIVHDKRRTLALLQAGRIRHTSLAFEIEHMARHGEVNLWRLESGTWRCFARHANILRQEPAV